jgi:hypothetical protein
MKNQNKSNAFMALALLALVVLACSAGDETEKANKLVGEGNATVQEAKKFYAEAEGKKEKMIQAVPSIKNLVQLELVRSVAKEAIIAYDKTKEKCNDTSRKFEEASKLQIKDKFKEYLTLKTKEFQKRAEIVETSKGTPQALIDSDSRSAFADKVKATNEMVEKLTKEADDLGAQADKLQKDNPDIFKS